MLAKSDKGFGEVHESFLRPKNLEALGLQWQRNRDGFVEERAETEREAVAVVLLSIFSAFFFFSWVGRLRQLWFSLFKWLFGMTCAFEWMS